MKEVPWGIRKALNWIKDHYNNPEVLITENGTADDAEHHGSLNDQQRIRYLTGYINNVLKGTPCVPTYLVYRFRIIIAKPGNAQLL